VTEWDTDALIAADPSSLKLRRGLVGDNIIKLRIRRK
jgi:hypothetical protein